MLEELIKTLETQIEKIEENGFWYGMSNEETAKRQNSVELLKSIVKALNY